MLTQIYERLEKHHVSEIKLNSGRLVLCKDVEFGNSYTLSYQEDNKRIEPTSRYFSLEDLESDLYVILEEFGVDTHRT